MKTRTVELDLADAKALARAYAYAEHVPALATAHVHLLASIDLAEKTPDSFEQLRQGIADLRESWDEAFERGRQRARGKDDERIVISTGPRPQWANVAKATRIIARTVHSDPSYIARVDNLGAYVRDTWDALGLSLHDEQTLYTALVMASLFVEMANNGREKGHVDPATVEAVAKIAQTFTAAVLEYLPEECRR